MGVQIDFGGRTEEEEEARINSVPRRIKKERGYRGSIFRIYIGRTAPAAVDGELKM